MNMKYNIEYDKRCLKYLKKLDKDDQLRIIKAINELPFRYKSVSFTRIYK